MTEQEMRARQEEAKQRVLEMQSRSRFAAEQMNRSLGGAAGESASSSANRGEPAKGLPNMSREELERLFILSLCLLLSQEEADQSVILGLMYLLT